MRAASIMLAGEYSLLFLLVDEGVVYVSLNVCCC